MFAWVHGMDAPASSKLVEEIYSQYKKLMFSTAGKYTKNISDQEDIVQTALERLLKIFQNINASQRCISASYIVYTIRSVSIDLLRKQGHDSELFVSIEDEQFIEQAKMEGSQDDLLLLVDCSEQLDALWPQVPPDDRILLEGKYIFGLTDKELAIILGCRASGIRMRLTRARRRAARFLSGREG